MIIFFWTSAFISSTLSVVNEYIFAFAFNITNYTSPQLEYGHKIMRFYKITDFVCYGFFLTDFLIRFSFSPNKLKFLFNLFNMIDLVTIFLFFAIFIIYTVSESYNEEFFTLLLFIRSPRILLLLKLEKLSWKFKAIGLTFKKSIQELILLVYVLILSVLIMSTIIYNFEFKQNAGFSSIPATFWYLNFK